MLRALRRLYSEFLVVLDLARREKLTRAAGCLMMVLLTGSLGFFIAEFGRNPKVRSYFDALYWGIVSVTTLGYGDIVPHSAWGRACAAAMAASFWAMMPLIGAIITSIYISRKIKGDTGLERVLDSKHTVICGWNNNGYDILAGLQERQRGSLVVLVGDLAADHFENLVESYPQLKLQFVRGPYTNEATLQRANVRAAAVALVLIRYGAESTQRSDEQAVLAVLTLRELAPDLRIVAECFASANRAHLLHAGANRVIVSGELDGFMLTAAALSPGLDMTLREAMTFGQGHDLWTQPIPQEYAGRKFIELAQAWLAERCWVVVGLVSREKKLGIADVLAGDKTSIDEFILRRFEQAGRATGGKHHLHYLNPGPEHMIRDGDQAIVIFPPEAPHGR